MFYIGKQEVKLDDTKEKEKLQLRIKNLLLLRNVNFLFGNGTSLPLGAPSISKVKSWLEQFDKKFEKAKDSEKTAYKIIDDNKDQFNSGLNILKDLMKNSKLDTDFETLLGILIQSVYAGDNTIFQSKKIMINDVEYKREEINSAINLIKTFIFSSCKSFVENLNDYQVTAHKSFIRKVLLRPATLPRIKIFTTNYDLVLEKCLDELGVYYFDGFVGGHEKRLRPESYNYDLYYPGETTEGTVNRVDRVLQLFKLHGSINWKRVKETAENIFGIKQEYPDENEISNLVIYPSTLKYGETLAYPYSEMFRLFSTSLFRPQTVLFTFGYSFKDEHINRIIYQALSIPTFNLVIVLPEGKEKNDDGNIINVEIARLIEKVDSKRIIVIAGGKLNEEKELVGIGTFKGFVDEIMPDMEEMDIQEKINKEIDKLFPSKNEFVEQVSEPTGFKKIINKIIGKV